MWGELGSLICSVWREFCRVSRLPVLGKAVVR